MQCQAHVPGVNPKGREFNLISAESALSTEYWLIGIGMTGPLSGDLPGKPQNVSPENRTNLGSEITLW